MLKVIPDERWPSGDCKDVAAINVSDSTLECWAKQPLQHGREPGLGRWVGLGGRLPSGAPIELIRYLDGLTKNEFVIRTDTRCVSSEIVAELAHELDLQDEAIVWRANEGQVQGFGEG